jgi:hypothetical protein
MAAPMSVPPTSVPPLDAHQLAQIVASLPAEVRPTFEQLLREAPGDLKHLRAQIVNHVARIERKAQHNEFLSTAEAAALRHVCLRVLDLYADADETRRRLVSALGRYFVLVDDGDPDFEIGGLDDDVAVANAVARGLGHAELVIELDE